MKEEQKEDGTEPRVSLATANLKNGNVSATAHMGVRRGDPEKGVITEKTLGINVSISE